MKSTTRWLIVTLSVASLAAAITGGLALAGEDAAGAYAGPIDIRNARMPLDGVLTGGQPTPDQIEQAAAAGYRTIVNTRSPAEEGFEWEKEKVESLGMRYLLIDVAGGDDLTLKNVARLAEVLDDPEAMPVLIHCRSGNRVGALLALKAAWIDGASPDEAMQLGLAAGLTRLEEKTRELVEQE